MNRHFNLNDFIEFDSLLISDVMWQIDRNTYGILFLKNANGVLTSCITDGDIRRHLLSGGKLSDQAWIAANKRPKTAKNFEEARNLYHERNYIVIPIVNENGVVVDLYMGEGDFAHRPHISLDTPVVINAGGKGTRLDPFTRVLPKPLIPIGDMPIIEHIMNEYQSYNCNEFHIIVNYKRGLIKAYFNDNERLYNINWYDEEKPLGTGGGLSLLRNRIGNTFFFANCDALLKANYESILKFHKENNNIITMICAYKTISIPYGIVEMGIDGEIKQMKEKPVMSFLTNTGIYVVEPKVIEDIEDDVSIDFPDIVEIERKKGRKVAVYPIDENEWMDMGQLPELEKMWEKLYGEQS